LLDPLAQAGTGDLAGIGAQLSRCVVDRWPEVVRAVRASLTPEAWETVSRSLYRPGRALKIANRALLVWEWSYKAMELAADLATHPGARAVTLFSKVRRTGSAWVLEPGRLGPYAVGMDAAAAQREELVTRAEPGAVCDFRWVDVAGPDEESPPDGRPAVATEWRRGDADDLDIASLRAGWRGAALPRTVTGMGIGSSVAELRSAYGARLSFGYFQAEGDPYPAFVVVGPRGAVMFALDPVPYDEELFEPGAPEPAPQSRVRDVHVTRGTSMADLEAFVGGC
jgi:hypothetical protein